jgi:hypothetical protein
MTKILSVVWYKVLPAQFGGQKGISQFNDFLSDHFPLTCICSSNNIPSGNEKYGVKPILPITRLQVLLLPAWQKIIRELKKGNYTHVILEHCYYGLLGILIKKRYHKFLIVHSHNIEYLRFKEMGRPWWPLLYWLEKKHIRLLTSACSKRQQTWNLPFHIFNWTLKNACLCHLAWFP